VEFAVWAKAGVAMAKIPVETSKADLRIIFVLSPMSEDAPLGRRLNPNAAQREASQQPHDNNGVRLQQFGNRDVSKALAYFGASTISI
jgi:hypothetical protein